MLYQLCKYYGIKVLFVHPLPLFNHESYKRHHINISLENPSQVFEKYYLDGKKYELSPETKQYLDRLRSKEGMEPPYIVFSLNRNWDTLDFNRIREWGKAILLLATGKLFEKIDVAWKCNKSPIDSMKSRMNYLQYILFKERIRQKDQALRRIYHSYTGPVDFQRKYVYFASLLQPEVGAWCSYQDQVLALELLSASLPQDWIIYFKEHPTTFMPGTKSSLARDDSYYRRIQKIRNVRMIPTGTDTFQLIDSAQAVATAGGTAGWEAVVRGKPTLNFGHSWYQGCRSVFNIVTLEDCRQAFERITKGYKPDPSDIERYAAAVEKVSEKNIIHGDYVLEKIRECADPKHEMERIGQMFVDAYQRIYVEQD